MLTPALILAPTIGHYLGGDFTGWPEGGLWDGGALAGLPVHDIAVARNGCRDGPDCR